MGTKYHGWQIQNNAQTVQEVLQNSLSVLLGNATTVSGCGRTDTGVHASEFFAHFDTDQSTLPPFLLHKWNGLLPKDIAILELFEVPDNFSARFDAVSRTYGYYMHKEKDPFKNQTSWYFSKALDFEKMEKAALKLLDYEDFQSFCKVKSENHHYRCIVKEVNFFMFENGYKFEIRANRFLRGMIRAIVGTLVLVGKGTVNLEGFEKIIESKDRTKAGPTVPAQGLFLEKIEYPQGILRPLV